MPPGPQDTRQESRPWVVVGAVTLILLALALLNVARVTLIGEPATLPAHLAPWATRARTFADLVREEATLRMVTDPRYLDAKNELGPVAAEDKVLPVLIQELEGEVELIRRIDALAQTRADLGDAPSVEQQQRTRDAFLDAARRGVLIDDAALEAELDRTDRGAPLAPGGAGRPLHAPGPPGPTPDGAAPEPGAATEPEAAPNPDSESR